MNTTQFFEALTRRAEGDTAVVANLRRSLSHDPGTFAGVFPYIEPFTQNLSAGDRRTVYLVAGLWAQAHRRESGAPLTLPAAMQRLAQSSGSNSVESRMVALLDADPDELVWRMRHAIGLTAAAGLALDWPALLADLLRWNATTRHVQQRWAREFWRHTPRDGDGAHETPAHLQA